MANFTDSSALRKILIIQLVKNLLSYHGKSQDSLVHNPFGVDSTNFMQSEIRLISDFQHFEMVFVFFSSHYLAKESNSVKSLSFVPGRNLEKYELLTWIKF